MPTVTHRGGWAYTRDAKSELVLLAVVNMVGEHTFYEPGGDRDERSARLVRTVAVEDGEWTAGFLGWLSGEARMRSASLVAAAEAVRARLAAGLHGGNRRLVDAVCLRAEPVIVSDRQASGTRDNRGQVPVSERCRPGCRSSGWTPAGTRPRRSAPAGRTGTRPAGAATRCSP